MNTSARRRAVVLGLDGVPFPLLQNLINKGHIPRMAEMFKNGYFGQMSVCIPEISSVSWSSFMTGKQSGEHGIYGFIDLEPGTYRMFFPNYAHLKAPTIWDSLAAQDRKAVVINMPSTYPARATNGVLISGFVAVDINKAVYPSALIPRLKEAGYRIDLDTARARQDHDFLFEDLNATLALREHAIEFLWEEVDWDLFMAVVTGTDRLMHFLWTALVDDSHAYHQHCLDYFDKVDALAGRLFDRFLELDGSDDQHNTFYMLSDHGFTQIKSEVHLNRWLQDEGYLKFETEAPKTIMEIGPGSKAFVMDPSRVYINLKGKYPLGTVDSGDYDKLRGEIKNGLENLTFKDSENKHSEKIVQRVYLKEELYHGPYLDSAPDLVALSHHGFDLKGKVSGKEVFGRTGLVGMHNQDEAFFFSSNGSRCSSIFELKDLILNRL